MARRRRPMIEPTVVVPVAGSANVDLVIRASDAATDVRLALVSEGGETLEGRASVRITGAADDHGDAAARIELPFAVPVGRHRLEVRLGRRRAECVLLAAPPMMWRPDPVPRELGLFAPVPSLRGANDHGAGGVPELRRALDLAGAIGGGWFGTLPLLARFHHEPAEVSPYAPVSRRFWDEALLDLDAAAETFGGARVARRIAAGTFQRRAATLRRRELQDPEATWALRWPILESLATAALSGDHGRRLERELRADADLVRYARFRATAFARGETWRSWPAAAREGRLTARHAPENVVRTFMVAQHIVRQQLIETAAAAADRGVRLYLDLPLGCHPGGFDTWSDPEAFADGVSMGAPPDAFITSGQDWTIPPPDPARAAEDGHAELARCVRAHLEVAGALRIDHVMGLHRVFWVPRGMPPTEGVYVSMPAAIGYAVLAIESHRAEARIVGEDLGTVPDAVREAMREHGVAGMHVAQFEIAAGTADPPRRAAAPARSPAGSVASLGTHDTPMLPGLLSGADARMRRELGLVDAAEAAALEVQSARLRTAIDRSLRRVAEAGDGSDADLVLGLLRYLAASSADVVLVDLAELLGQERPWNVPGTVDEHPNWRRRFDTPIEVLAADRRLRSILRELAARRA